MTATTDDSNGNFLPECAGITHTHASTLESRFNVKCSEQPGRADAHRSNSTGTICTRATRQEGQYTQEQPDRRADTHKGNQTGGPIYTRATRQEGRQTQAQPDRSWLKGQLHILRWGHVPRTVLAERNSSFLATGRSVALMKRMCQGCHVTQGYSLSRSRP